MPGFGRTQQQILIILNDGAPKSLRQIIDQTGLSSKAISCAVHRLWKIGAILRTVESTYEALQSFKGRSGIRKNTRAYHLYLYMSMRNTATVNGIRFVKCSEKYLDKRGSGVSKARLIREFLKKNSDKAFYSTDIADALNEQGIYQRDIMATVRRAEKKGLIYVRGYRTHDNQTPFRKGYIITWIDPTKPREQTLEEAIERSDRVLLDTTSISPIIQRVHMIRDVVIESTKLRDLASFEFIQNKLGCTEYKAEGAIERSMQLYPDILETKLFRAFRYYYHQSMPIEELKAAAALKENYIRKVKGRANRIGHNWEAVPGWFIDKFTTGAKFWTQRHRSNMDPRRITIHLIKPVGGRRQNAEVDRVWEVTPGPLLQPTTYVLECKWGLVQKRHIDDFFDVLRWSKEFGVDTPDGRQIKQSVTGVFAASSFDPRESVRLKDETVISLASYTARMNIQLLKASDFNGKLREREVTNKVTVQKICRYARDEKGVRELLEKVWIKPDQADEVLVDITRRNSDVYEFEKMLAS